MSSFTKPGASLLRDPRDVRLRDRLVEDIGGADIVVLGVPWDWSVTGRPGARFAPHKIRSYLYSLTTFSPSRGEIRCGILDLGDVKVSPGDWATTRNRVKEAIRGVLSQGKKFLVLGGDHSITGPVLEALLEHGSVGLFFLDSHYDLRSVGEGYSSGTWLWELYESYGGRSIRTVVVGIEDYSNPAYLSERAAKLGVRVVSLGDIVEEGLQPAFEAIDWLAGEEVDHYYVSVDMDHLGQAYTPGVNAPASIGMTPRETLALLGYTVNKLDPVGVDFTEVTPTVDLGDSTSRLTARLAAATVGFMCKR